MTGTVHAVAQAAASVPGYCTSGHGVLTSAQWKQCWDLGWNQSYSTPVSGDLAGHGSGLGIVAVLVVIAVVLIAVSRLGKRSPAAQRS
jgi:hypothetical protein